MLRVFCVLSCLVSLAWAETPLIVKVDGKQINFPYEKPHEVAGHTLVPMRGIFEAIGAYVEWDGTNHRVTCRKEDEEIVLAIGSRVARKNGAEIQIDIAPRVMHGTTMVPLRFIAESLGAKVNFDAGNNIVEITTDGSPARGVSFPLP
jgi:hypothetical protein